MTSKPFSDDAYAEPSEESLRAQRPTETTPIASEMERIARLGTYRNDAAKEAYTASFEEIAKTVERLNAMPKLEPDPTAKYDAATDTWTLTETHWVMQPEPGKVLRVKLPSGAPVDLTPAGKLEFVSSLLKPVDDDGNALPPLISKENALKMLDLPELDELVLADSFYCNCGETTAKAPGATIVTCHECGWRWTKNEHDSDWSHEDSRDRAAWLASLKPGDRVKLGPGDWTDVLMTFDPSVRGPDAIYIYQGKCEHIDACRVTWDGSHGFTCDGYCHESKLVKP